jgi:hypothetical protein
VINQPELALSPASGEPPPWAAASGLIYVTADLLQSANTNEDEPHGWWDGVVQ